MHLNAGVWNRMSMNASGFLFCFKLDYVGFFLSEKVNKCSFNSQRESLNTFQRESLNTLSLVCDTVEQDFPFI